jgi:quaternary ammonium compound-resistance protein SugE
VAGLFEIGWAIGLKYTHGFTRLTPSLLTLASMALSMLLLGLALKTLPVGTAYAVWTGIGTGRHGAPRNLPLRRTGDGAAPRLHRPDRRGILGLKLVA